MDGKIVNEFSRLRVLTPNPLNRTQSGGNRRSLIVELRKEEQNGEEETTRMDALVQDLNSALEESTRLDDSVKIKEQQKQLEKQQHYSSGKRRVWRRRCKSTSNLVAITPGANVEKFPLSNNGTKDVIATTESASNNIAMTNTVHHMKDETGI